MDGVAGPAERSTDLTGRRVVGRPPPLVPEFRQKKPDSGRRVQLIALLLILVMAVILAAPWPLTAAIATLCALVLVQHAHARRRLRQATALKRSRSAHRRNELERLADRMWELQESEERLRGLIDALGDIVVHRDRDGRIVYANPVVAGVVGADPETLQGKKLPEIGIDVGVVPDSAFADGECLSSTDVAIQTDAGVRWFSWVELSIRDSATGTVSHRAIARDITARKRAEGALITARERAESANQAKSRFLATVSHEIRTPMNGIMGMAKLLADTSLSQEQQTYVGAVSVSASALLALIEDLLDYSKIEFGRLQLEPQPLSPRELVENVVELLAPRAHGKGIGLGCFIAPDVPEQITADPGRLRQVLLNVAGNAVKFTESGGVLVSVELRRTAEVSRLEFSISDTGPGLRAEEVARIFDEFEQADGTSTRKHGGAGLGLSISRRIVEAMRGSITAHGTPDRGSEFRVSIPVTEPVERTIDRTAALRDISAIIISRNLMEAEALARSITAHGGHASIARTVEEAARAAGERPDPYNVVMLDAAMEKSDGRLLRRLGNAGVECERAITLIAPPDRGRLAEYRASGYDTFLVRPVRGETLLRILLQNPEAIPESRERNEAERRSSEDARGRLSVLVAEDNGINALLARSVLEKAGHRVEIVGNGRAAVEALTGDGGAHRFDVVLMDLHMPVMDGIDAIAHIRKFEEAKGIAQVPILVLSADGQESTRNGVIAYGATGFLTKPVDPEAVIAAVEQHSFA